MEPRDVFDGALIVLVTVVVYLEVFGFGISTERLRTIADAVLGQPLAVYLVLAAILGVVFLGYITVYLPDKYSRGGPEPPG